MTLPDPASTALHCPKCGGAMRSYERSGIHVDQCRECRGIFLDRGELERLIDLEAQATLPGSTGVGVPPRYGDPGTAAPGGYADPRYGDPRDRRDRDWDDDDDDDRDRRFGGDPRYAGRAPGRRRGFLGDLFDGFGD